MAYADAFAYIIYIAYLTSFLAILAGAIYFARGDLAKGKKYVSGAIVVALVVVLLPHALDYILGPTYATPTGGDFDAYANLIYPYPDKITQTGNTMTFVYSHPLKATASLVIIRLNFSTPTGSSAYWYVIIPPDNNPISITATSPIYITVKYPRGVYNDKVLDEVTTTYSAKQMVEKHDLNIIDINENNAANVTATYIIGANGTSITYIMHFTYTGNGTSGGEEHWYDAIKNVGVWAVSKLYEMILGGMHKLGQVVLKYLPFLTGEEAMIYFTLLPTDKMLGQGGDVIKNIYYNVSLPWGMVILLALGMLSAIERVWNGDDDIAFSLAKDIVGTLIWMFGGYYFYMAFAGFINTIIISIGIQYLLRMGYYIDLLVAITITYSMITLVVSDNASGGFISFIMGAVAFFEAIALMRFFLIAAVVALFPLIAPWGLIKESGISKKSIITGIIKQGVYGILIVGLLRIIFTLIDQGSSLGVGVMLLPIAFLFSPRLIGDFVGAIAEGNIGHGNVHHISSNLLSTVKTAGLRTGKTTASKIATYRARKFEGEVPRAPGERISVVGGIGTAPPATPETYTEVGTTHPTEHTIEASRTAEEETYVELGTTPPQEENKNPTENHRKTSRTTAPPTRKPRPRTATIGNRFRRPSTRVTRPPRKVKPSRKVIETSGINAAARIPKNAFRFGDLYLTNVSPKAQEILKSHAYQLDRMPTAMHKAEYSRKLIKELEEHAKPSYVKAGEGIAETFRGIKNKDVKHTLKGARRLGGGLVSMAASAVLRANLAIAELTGDRELARTIRESYRRREAYKEALRVAELSAIHHAKIYEEKVLKPMAKNEEHLKQLMEETRAKASASIHKYTEPLPPGYMSELGKELHRAIAPLAKQLVNKFRESRIPNELKGTIPGEVTLKTKK